MVCSRIQQYLACYDITALHLLSKLLRRSKAVDGVLLWYCTRVRDHAFVCTRVAVVYHTLGLARHGSPPTSYSAL
jgi:CRISPR/Cas system-associated endoribonuclease Cas2